MRTTSQAKDLSGTYVLPLSHSAQILPDQLYSPEYVANLAGVHKQTVYQSIKGTRIVPLPIVTRLGRLIRFRGSHILNWLDLMAGITPDSNAVTHEKQVEQAHVIKRRGRPPLQPKTLVEVAA
jgi:predicted DNA-binding transcriptional regulator AlpA